MMACSDKLEEIILNNKVEEIILSSLTSFEWFQSKYKEAIKVVEFWPEVILLYTFRVPNKNI